MPGRKIEREIVKGRQCPQEGCKGKHIVVVRTQKQGQRILTCTLCGYQFSESKGTPFFNLKTPIPKILATLKAVIDGGGIRAAERMTGVHRDTITRWVVLAGKQAEIVEEMLVTQVNVSHVQIDEMWTFIVKKTNIPINSSVLNGRPWLRELMSKGYQRPFVNEK